MNTPHPLTLLRGQIDMIDDQLIMLLARRYALLPEIVKIKAAHNMPHRDEARVQALIARNVKRGIELGLPDDLVKGVYEAILDASHRYEQAMLEK